jgi:hypothetical protein
MKLNYLKIMLASIGILATLSAIQGMDEKPNDSPITNSFSTGTHIEYNNIDLNKIDYEMPPLFHKSDGDLDINSICILNICPLILTIIMIGAQFL